LTRLAKLAAAGAVGFFRLYVWADSLWQWIAEKVFVRFEFDLPVAELQKMASEGRLVFALTHGGIIEWLILSSWCRKHGLGAILVANRKRVLFFAKPLYFLQILFRSRRYSQLFLGKEKGPRLIFSSGRERARPFEPTPVETLLCEIYSATAGKGEAPKYPIVPIFILWRKHMRGSVRSLGEYFFGLSSNPNNIGKIWYLARKRKDSTVRALTTLRMGESREALDYDDAFDDSEAMRVAKLTRRKILILSSQEMRVVVGPRFASPISVKETLMRDPEILAVIREVAAKEGVDQRKVMSRAYQNLTEIAANYRFRFVEVMYVVLTWVFTKVFDGLEADEEELHKVRELMKTKAVVFAPCHRSHLDYLVIPYLFFIHDMVTPHILAGINLAFWPVGYFLRMGGAFFVRRSFRGDALYSICLKKYVHFLLHNRFNIKFFPEGTRSRSGKMLAPAYGFLKMALEAYQQKVCDDIAIIPVSICYDEVPEQGAYTKELAGGAKVKESARELLKSRKLMKRNIGKVYVKFADPLFVKDITRTAAESGMDFKLMLQKTAFQVCKGINDVTPIIPKSLVSSVLLGADSAALSLEEILRHSMELLAYAQHSGSPLSVEGEEPFRRAVEQTIRRLLKSSVLNVSDSVPRGYYCEPRKRVLLNFYKNSAIHCLNSPAISLIAYFSTLREEGVLPTAQFAEKLLQSASELRNLLKFEFFFDPSKTFQQKVDDNIGYLSGMPDWKNRLVPDVTEGILSGTRGVERAHIYMRLLGDLLEAYTYALQSLKDPLLLAGPVDKKAWVQKIVKQVESLSPKQAFSFPEAVSIQNFSNSLLLFDNLELLKIEGSHIHFQRWDDRMDALLASFSSYLAAVKEPLSLGVKNNFQ